jgi:cytochrome c oxidase subunit 4
METQENTLGTYFKVYGALMLLLAATVGAVYINLGPFNVVLALAIASLKAILVILFFMHVRHSSRLIWIYAGIGFVWLSYLLIGVVIEFLTRT